MSEKALQLIAKEKEERTGRLNLGNCGLRDWPEELFELTWLEELIVGNGWVWDEVKQEFVFGSFNDELNRLNYLPEKLEQLSNLKMLYLSSLGIKRIKHLDKLTALILLDLSGNRIKQIENLDNLKVLTKLDLSSNEIKRIENLDKLAALTSINLFNNLIKRIENLDKLTTLSSLNLVSNKIKHIENLDNLTNLNTLDLSENQIKKIKNLDNLKSLTKFYLVRNQIRRLENIDNLIGLTELSLKSNHSIKRIENLDTLIALSVLDFSWNQIKRLENLDKCTALTKLILSYNEIQSIENLENLAALNTLDLSANKIKIIENIEPLKALKYLKLLGNPTKNFPEVFHERNIYSSCKTNWLLWKNELDGGSIENYTIKMMLTGNGNVGKSSLIEALKNGKCTEKKISTHGVVINSDLKHNKGKLFTWDFGGQEIYHGTHRLFMNSDALQLIVFDNETEAITETPDRIVATETTRNHLLEYWIENVIDNNARNPIILVQNKFEDRKVNLKANEIAGKNNYRYDKVIATEGIGIDDLQYSIDKLVKQLPDYGMLIPEKWSRMVDYFLEEQQKDNPDQRIITIKEFEKIAEKYGINPTVYDLLLTYLSNSGFVYHDENYMPDHIIVNQKWVLDKIYAVMKRDSDFYNYMRREIKGFCSLSTLWMVWGSQDSKAMKQLFTQFMRSCAICFPLRDEYAQKDEYHEYATYVFPEFLPKEKPLHVKQKQEDRKDKHAVEQYRYTHSYIGYKVMQQLIVEFGDKTQKCHYWRTGIMVVDESSSYFLIEYLENEPSLLLTIEKATDSATKAYVLEKMYWALNHKTKGWQQTDSEGAFMPCDIEELIKQSNKSTVELPQVIDKAPLKIAISYAKEDNRMIEGLFNPLEELVKNLKIAQCNNLVSIFYDNKIDKNKWAEQIADKFKAADLIIILNSPNYNQPEKEFIWDIEFPIIEEKHNNELQPGLSVIKINIVNGPENDRLNKIYSFKKGLPIPKSIHERAEYFKDLIEKEITEKIINKKQSNE